MYGKLSISLGIGLLTALGTFLACMVLGEVVEHFPLISAMFVGEVIAVVVSVNMSSDLSGVHKALTSLVAGIIATVVFAGAIWLLTPIFPIFTVIVSLISGAMAFILTAAGFSRNHNRRRAEYCE